MKRKHQERATIIADNLSTPHRPRSLKAPKPVMVQAKASATVRTNDAPTEMGKHSARFRDPVGNAMKARKEYRAPKIDMSYRWSDQPDGDAWLHDARERDRMAQYLVMSDRNRDRGFKPDSPPLPCVPCTVAPGTPYTVPRCGTLYDHATNTETPREAFSIALRPVPMPRVIPLPANPYTATMPATWNHKPRKPTVVVTVVRKIEDHVFYDAPTWSQLVSSLKRVPINSKSKRKRGTRILIPTETTRIYAHTP